MWTPEYYVRFLPFPASVGGVVTPNSNGSFSIYISSKLSESQQKLQIAHEVAHITNDHFYRAISITAAETEAGENAIPVADEPRRHVPHFRSQLRKEIDKQYKEEVSSEICPMLIEFSSLRSFEHWLAERGELPL